MNTKYFMFVYDKMHNAQKDLSYEDYIDKIKTIDKEHTHQETLGMLKIDLSSKQRHYPIRADGETKMVSIISEKERAERTAIREKMIETTANFIYSNDAKNRHYKNLFVELGGQVKDGSDNDRNFAAFYNTPNGMETCEKLKNPDLSEQEKRAIFSEYLDGCIKRAEKTLVAPKNHKELSERYGELYSACQPLSLDTLDDATKSFGFTVDEATKEKYMNCKDFVQGSQSLIVGKTEQILDETYLYFNGDDAKTISTALEDQYIGYETDVPGAFNKAFCDGNEKDRNISFGDPHKGFLKFMQATGKIDDRTVFVGKDGFLSKEQADRAIHNNERVECVNGKGEVTTLAFDEDGMLKAKENIAPTFSPENKKMFEDKFKNCLDTLNSGTSIFTISSKEYKGMRNILKNLSSGINDRKEAGKQIKEFKGLMDTYLKNHEKKETLSATALKRKDCVDKVKEEMDTLFDSFDVDSNLVKEASEKNAELSKADDVRHALDPEVQKRLDEDVRDASTETAQSTKLPEREVAKERTAEPAPQIQE